MSVKTSIKPEWNHLLYTFTGQDMTRPSKGHQDPQSS